MPYDDHKNFAYSTVATPPAPAASGTSLVVLAGTGSRFPTPPFNATIWPDAQLAIPTNAEIVRVTAIATDTLTIARAQEGSSARAVVVADQIAATITDKVLTDIETGIPTAIMTVLASDTSLAEVHTSTTETTLFTYTVPGGTLGTSGQLLLQFFGDYENFSAGAGGFTLRVKYGGTVIGLVGAASTFPAEAGRRALVGDVLLAAAGTTGAQRTALRATLGMLASAAGPPTVSAIEGTTTPAAFANGNNGLAIDSASAQALDLTVQMLVQNHVNHRFRLHSVLVRKG